MRIGNFNHPYVTETKLEEMQKLVEGALSGDRVASLRMKEHFTTGDDSVFAFAALTQIQVIQNFEDEDHPRNWQKIATTRSVDDFETPRLYTFEPTNRDITGNSRKAKGSATLDNPDHILPVVPEGTPYPKFQLKPERYESEMDILRKRGGLYSLSWERFLKDPDNIISILPELFTNSFLDAEEFEVWSTLLAAITGNASTVGLKAGQTVLEDAVPANSKISRDALEVALKQLKTREYDGRPMNLQQFKLLVPIGTADDVRMMVSLWTPTGVRTDVDGVEWNLNYPAPGWNPLSSITEIVESEYFTGTEWAIIATPPAGKRPGLELLKLQGHETPDIRIKADQGFRAGGGSVGVFEGSFDTDDIELRARYPLQGVSWTPEYILYSDGTK